MKLSTFFLGVSISVLLLSAIFPLLGKRYIPTHDGEYHIIRIVEFSKMLQAGSLFPRWAPDLNSGYGIPIFQYHYPFPNYVGSLFRVFTHDAVLAFQLSGAAAIMFLFAGLTYWLLYFFPRTYAALGAIVGVYTPYVFLDVYIRGSIGEIWAIGFFAFALGYMERKKYYGAAVCFAGIVLSHNILGMLFGLFLGVYTIYRKRSVIYLGVGVLVSAFFWMPAIFEQKYVVGLNTVNFRDHFVQLYELLIPSWGSEFSATGGIGNKMSFQLGMIPIIVLGISACISYKHRHANTSRLLLFFLMWMFGVLLLMFPSSTPFWEILTPVQFIQYPWRLLAFVIPITAFSASYVFTHIRSLYFVYALLFSVLAFTYRYSRPVTYEPRDEHHYISRKNFSDGTSSMGNSFSTVWTSWKEVRPTQKASVINGTVVDTAQRSYTNTEFEVDMIQSGLMDIHTLYFPGWTAYIDGKKTDIFFRDTGTIRIGVPSGTHMVRLKFEDTPIRTVANIISIASFITLTIWGILSVRKARR